MQKILISYVEEFVIILLVLSELDMDFISMVYLFLLLEEATQSMFIHFTGKDTAIYECQILKL